jgi:hypothetical protein
MKLTLPRKILLAFTVALFLASLLWAPFLLYNDVQPVCRALLPIWTLPGTFHVVQGKGAGFAHLDFTLLLIEWIVLAVLSASLFLWLNPNPPLPKPYCAPPRQ